MDAHVIPHPLSGCVHAHASKSVAHRDIILAALADEVTDLACDASSDDVEATIRCVSALGAHVRRTHDGLSVIPIGKGRRTGKGRGTTVLDVGESGTTLRLLLPVVAALDVDARLTGHGRLAERPLSPLREELCAHGCALSASGTFPLTSSGRLRGGTFTLPGNVSSQYVSGLLMAAPLVDEDVDVIVLEPVESEPYVQLTIDALERFGVRVDVGPATVDGRVARRYRVAGTASLESPGTLRVEGDWSNAGFWLVAGALSDEGVSVCGLDVGSSQGDRAVMDACSRFGAVVRLDDGRVTTRRGALAGTTVSLADTPDLVAPLAALAAHSPGQTTLMDAARLTLKESNRLETVGAAVRALGGSARHTADMLVIGGQRLTGGVVDAAADHRVAMLAAIAAAYATGPTTIRGAECVSKSYPTFFEDFAELGGKVSLGG